MVVITPLFLVRLTKVYSETARLMAQGPVVRCQYDVQGHDWVSLLLNEGEYVPYPLALISQFSARVQSLSFLQVLLRSL
jgi:hypothetical protein